MKAKVHVKKGDTVLVITGKDKGKKGKVLEVLPEKSRVVIEGVNKAKRHTKPSQKLPQGGINEKEAPIHSSNVMLVCTKCGKPTRVAKQVVGEKNVRACKECGEVQAK